MTAATEFRRRLWALLRAEADGPAPRDVVVFAVDGLPFRLAAEHWPEAATECHEAVVPTTSSAGWLSSLTGLDVADHGVPGVVFGHPLGTGEQINVLEYEGTGLAETDSDVFEDARELGYLSLAVLGDLECYPGAWRDALVGRARPVLGHRFYTEGRGRYAARPPREVERRVRAAVDAALDGPRTRPRLVWCFIEWDQHIHRHGYDTSALDALHRIGRIARELHAGGALVVAHSDHGLTPTRHDPQLADLLGLLARRHGFTMGGAGRTRWLHTASGTHRRLLADLMRLLPDDVRVVASDEMCPSGSLARSRMGEICLVAQGELFLSDPEYRFDHGSVLDDERLIPFSSWGGDE